jgi:ribosome-associated heat shock protein Hsp15
VLSTIAAEPALGKPLHYAEVTADDTNKTMTGVRMDKWLWASRFFKTRALAAKACDLGRIEANKQPAKPAREVRVGDMLQIGTEGGQFQVEVLALSEVRGPAPVAQTLYRETDISRELRMKAAEERRVLRDFTPAPLGRPSKRDRRKIIRFRGEGR